MSGLLDAVLFGNDPRFPGMVNGKDELPFDGGPLGTWWGGGQGTGKTTALANHLLDRAIAFEDQAIFILDWSGDLTNKFIASVLMQPDGVREKLMHRIVYDRLGDPDWTVPLPEFSKKYGQSYEEQVNRVSQNLEKLAPALVEGAPYLAGLGLKEIAPQIFRLLTAMEDENGDTFQITEAKKLLVDGNFRRMALQRFGGRVPAAKWFLENIYNKWSDHDRDMRTYSIIALLGAIEPREVRGRYGYYEPAWTPKKAIAEGQIVIVDGSKLINQKDTQYHLFTQAYSLIMAEINNRQPANPNDKPVSLVLDEVYPIIQIPKMAEELGMISPVYRGRKLQLHVVNQALWQLEKNLREKIWSLGNIVCFRFNDMKECYEIAEQLFNYKPRTVKLNPKLETQQPVLESDRGQYLLEANFIHDMKFRECIIRRYWNERSKDKYLRHVKQTRDYPHGRMSESVESFKERKLRENGVPIRVANDIVNRRGNPREDDSTNTV